MKAVHKARYITAAPAVFTAVRDRASERAQERAEAVCAENMRRTAHRLARDVLGAYSRGVGVGHAHITMAFGSWSLLHACLADPSLRLGPKRATEILQAIDPLITELSALAKRATNAGGAL